jgi:hypothetical protein
MFVGVAVHILEAVGLAVRGRHQLDHADVAVAGDAGCLVEVGPAAEVSLDLGRQIDRNAFDPYRDARASSCGRR